ncbi:MAG: hypothetical protein ACERKZ_20270 [Lachnotalea sp.]
MEVIGFVEMVGVILQCIILFIIIDKIAVVKPKIPAYLVKLVCLCFYVFIWHYIKKAGSWRYTIGIVFDIFDLSLYTIILKRQKFLMMFSTVMAANIINNLLSLLVSVFVFITMNLSINNPWYPMVLLFGYILKFVPLFLLSLADKKNKISQLLRNKNVQIIVVILGVLLQVSRQPIYVYTKKTETLYVYISFTIVVMVIVFSILWVVDRYFVERERKQLWTDNQRMAKRLHKSKEIFPVLNQALEKMKSNEGINEYNELLNEIHQLCNEQICESEKEDMQFKSFPSTGIHILDEQIQLYGKEAASKGINFDVFVSMSMSDALKERDILQIDFLQLIGNLMRNAFRAIEKKENKIGNILLVMGCVNKILEIEIFDDGVQFPIHILNEFGKRGNTEGGTGQGLAEIIEFLGRYKATYKLTEYDDLTGFSKGISILWNQKNGRLIESYRSGQISQNSILYYNNFKIADSPEG